MEEQRVIDAYFPLEPKWKGRLRTWDWHAPREGYPHEGTDFVLPEGTFLFAICDGVVKYNGPAANLKFETNGGNALVYAATRDALYNPATKDYWIKKGDYFLYLHLIRKPKWVFGNTFKAGEGIATSGDTGLSDPPHLHLGWLRNYKSPTDRGALNPIPLMQELIRRGNFVSYRQ